MIGPAELGLVMLIGIVLLMALGVFSLIRAAVRAGINDARKDRDR